MAGVICPVILSKLFNPESFIFIFIFCFRKMRNEFELFDLSEKDTVDYFQNEGKVNIDRSTQIKFFFCDDKKIAMFLRVFCILLRFVLKEL